MKITAVVASRNEGPLLQQTVASLAATLRPTDEILVVDDGSTDESTCFDLPASPVTRLFRTPGLGATKARNLGASLASGDCLVFCDAHILAPKGWWDPLVTLLDRKEVGAVAPAIADISDARRLGCGMRFAGPDLEIAWFRRKTREPHEAPALPGACLAMRASTFAETGGFDEGLIRWGSEDMEISIRLWLLGYELWVAPAVAVEHHFRTRHPYSVEWRMVIHNKLRLAMLHFEESRIASVVDALKSHEQFGKAVALLAASDVSLRRQELASKRIRDSEWFFSRFEPGW